jgi:hypothetical protein
MALVPIQPTIPDAVTIALRRDLPSFQSFRSADPPMRQLLLGARQGLPAFTMGVPDVLMGGAGIKGAQASGWRVAVRAGATALAADIYSMARGGKNNLDRGTPRLACIRQGAEVVTLLQAIAALSAPPLADQLPSGPCEIRLLVMPGLFTDALWVKPQNPGLPDAFVPFYTLVENITVKSPYSEQDLIVLLRPVAEKWTAYAGRLATRQREYSEAAGRDAD